MLAPGSDGVLDVIERGIIPVLGPNSEEWCSRKVHIFHDFDCVRRVFEGGRVIVTVKHWNGDRGGVVTPWVSAIFNLWILSSNYLLNTWQFIKDKDKWALPQIDVAKIDFSWPILQYTSQLLYISTSIQMLRRWKLVKIDGKHRKMPEFHWIKKMYW